MYRMEASGRNSERDEMEGNQASLAIVCMYVCMYGDDRTIYRLNRLTT